MAVKKKSEKSLVRMIALPYIVVIILILTIAFVLMHNQARERIMDVVDGTITDYSTTLSENPGVISMVEEGVLSPDMETYLDHLNADARYIDYIVVVDANDIRLYHPNHDLIGKKFQGDDEGPALAGSEHYLSDGKGSREYQRRSFNTVYDEQGKAVGFVMVSCQTLAIQSMHRAELINLLLLFGAGLLVTLLIALFTAHSIRNRLMGYEPGQLAAMFRQREEVLGNLREGMVLLDLNGQSEYMSASAKRFLSKGKAGEGEIAKTLETEILPLYQPNNRNRHAEIRIGDASLLVDFIPIQQKGKQTGTLVLLNDRTESVAMAEELTGVSHIIAALRATTHEQKNRLHVILGLLQLGENDEAMKYIASVSKAQDESSAILNSIENKTLAALILGKENRAKELGIHFTLQKGSHLKAHNDYLSAADTVTIVGNLVENAFDALKNQAEEREVNLFIDDRADGLVIIVDDTGPGMDEETIQKLSEDGFTTKGEGHGTGMRLIRTIVNRCHGSLEIESEPGEGSSFTVSIQEKRKHPGKENV
jgi:sensor histidine kinase regulating citrate/malate metabolism